MTLRGERVLGTKVALHVDTPDCSQQLTPPREKKR